VVSPHHLSLSSVDAGRLPRLLLKKRARNLVKKANRTAKAFALAAAKVAAGRHCSDIVALDLRGKSPATDYFVIALQRFGRAGYEQARWILLDFVDVVIHIFDSEYRDYYDLELLWGDAERLAIDK
jgi:ribosome-associated protein